METISNLERGCGFLQRGGIYLRADISEFGTLPPFVEFIPSIPYVEKHFRGWEYFNGLQFELTCFPKTLPKNQIKRHIQELEDGHEYDAYLIYRKLYEDGETNNFHISTLKSPFTFDLLMWIGESYYPTPQDFINEANTLGVNKKISSKRDPPNIWKGNTKLYLIHPHGCGKNKPGIIGYTYLTRAIYVKTDKIPKWITDMDKLNKLDIVDIDKEDETPKYSVEGW